MMTLPRFLRPAGIIVGAAAVSLALVASGMALLDRLGIVWGDWTYQALSLAVLFVGALPVSFGVYWAVRRLSRRAFRWMALGALPLFLSAVVLHNVIYGLTGFEEPVFFLLGVLVAPVLLWVGLAGVLAPSFHFRPRPR